MTYRCAFCQEEFELGDDEIAQAEARELWGIADPQNDPRMVLICDGCFGRMRPEDHPDLYKESLEEMHGKGEA